MVNHTRQVVDIFCEAGSEEDADDGLYVVRWTCWNKVIFWDRTSSQSGKVVRSVTDECSSLRTSCSSVRPRNVRQAPITSSTRTASRLHSVTHIITSRLYYYYYYYYYYCHHHHHLIIIVVTMCVVLSWW